MNIRIAFLGVALIAAPGLAQQRWQDSAAETTERTAMLKTLDRGKAIRGSGGQFHHLPQIGAVALEGAESPEQALARIGEAGAQVVETKGKLVLFRSANARTASVARSGDATVYPAVMSARSGALGVLTGLLVVRPKSMADADTIASSHGLEKVRAYSQLQTVFYKAKEGVDIADATAALQADSRVEIAYPEIIERVRVPR